MVELEENLSSEIATDWKLSFDEFNYLDQRQIRVRFDYAIALLFYKNNGRFPTSKDDIPAAAKAYIADQLRLQPIDMVFQADRSVQRRNLHLRSHLNFEAFTEANRAALQDWLNERPALHEVSDDDVIHDILMWCVGHKCTAPSTKYIARLLTASRSKYSDAEYARIVSLLEQGTKNLLDKSLDDDAHAISFLRIRSGPGRSSKAVFLEIAECVTFIQSLNLPVETISKLHPDW